VQTGDTEDPMRRKPKVIPVRSTLLSVVLILSAVLFVSLALISCKSESDSRRKEAEELPQTPPNKAKATATGVEIPAPALVVEPAKPMGRTGFVAGGVVGGVAASVIAPAPLVEMEQPNFNTEEYGHFAENPFLKATDNPLSTFSVDVDRASYSN